MSNRDPDRFPPPTQPETGSVDPEMSMPPRRPFGVTLLLWLVLCLSAWGLLRLAGALRWWDLLYDNHARLSPMYLSITGAGWALAGIVLIWSIFSRRRGIHLAIPVALCIWIAQNWIERIYFEAPRSNLPFAIIVSLLAVALTWIIASHRTTKIYLTKSEEHEQSDKHSAPS